MRAEGKVGSPRPGEAAALALCCRTGMSTGDLRVLSALNSGASASRHNNAHLLIHIFKIYVFSGWAPSSVI